MQSATMHSSSGGGTVSYNEEDELDKLLLGLDKLTETLPDLHRVPPYGSESVTPNGLQQQQQFPVKHTNGSIVALRSAPEEIPKHCQSRDNYDGGLSSLKPSTTSTNDMDVMHQPYHTRADSKPFSYFRSTSNGSRTVSRASSRDNSSHQPGLESPSILRKIMGNGDSDSRPMSPSVTLTTTTTSRGSSPAVSVPIQRTFSPAYQQQQQQQQFQANKSSSSLIKESVQNMTDEEASLTWLQKQQRKLEDRRAAQRRREGGPDNSLMRELKTSLDRARSMETATTDGYAGSETTASAMFSETSTRESSPHKQRIVPIQLEVNGGSSYTTQHHSNNIMRTSTPKTTSQQQPLLQQPDIFHASLSLSRQASDTSYDRSRPLINRRLRYDSEGETSSINGGVGIINSAVSNTSIDSLASRPITPGFPNIPATPIFGQPSSSNSIKRGMRAPSPSAGSMYHQMHFQQQVQQPPAASGSRASSRRGSVSSEPADVSAHHVQLAKDHYKYWYKPHISREDAIAILKPRPPGTFVVRDSNSFPGAFGLALKVATPPVNTPASAAASAADPGDELVRHFLVEPTSKGVKLKGYSNEPVFASLSALVYQHTVTPMALPTRLVLPQADLASSGSNRDSLDSRTSNSASQMQQLLSLGAACDVMYLFTMETDSLTGPNAVKKAVSQLMLTRPKPHPTLVHFKVSSHGITLTDHGRKLFFRKHYNTSAISFCGIDPEDRRWAAKAKSSNSDEVVETSQRIFGFVAKKATSRAHNQCHVFAEQDPDQPARAIVNFVNKVLLNSGTSGRVDVV